jgi:polyhydroxyalkanoate synthesis repressor PhaR
MKEKRLIKKYQNRRLYDTQTSCYITLDEVKELVKKYVDFEIIEEKTGVDITNHILLQIISDLEDRQSPIFTTDILKNIICFYDCSIQKQVSLFLEDVISLISQQQKQAYQQMQKMFPYPSKMEFDKLSHAQLAWWQTAVEKFFRSVYRFYGFSHNKEKND